jgi:lysozyme
VAALALCLIQATAPARAGATKQVRGIDVSRFQEHIAWKQVGVTPIGFAFVQASRGSGADCLVVPERCGADEFYERNYKDARANGIRVGAYHRAFPSGAGIEGAKADAREEANLFIATVGTLRPRDLLPALDIEAPFPGMDEVSLRAWISAWLNRVEKKLGRRAIIYTNDSSWLQTGDTTSFALEGHPLWIANYGVPHPLVPAGDWAGMGWSIWQFTSSGHVRGIEGHVDKNRLSNGFRDIGVR